MPDTSPNHNIKTSNVISYNNDELDTMTHNHQYPTWYILSQKVYSYILKTQKVKLVCGIIDDQGGNLKDK